MFLYPGYKSIRAAHNLSVSLPYLLQDVNRVPSFLSDSHDISLTVHDKLKKRKSSILFKQNNNNNNNIIPRI